MKYVTRIERFQAGDYPMVCVRSGLPATKMVPVQARRSTVWPWFLLPISLVWFAVAKWAADSDHPWGKLPFAEGQVNGITATYEKSIGVIINGAHADFVEATRRAQAAQQPADPIREPVALGDPLMSSGTDRQQRLPFCSDPRFNRQEARVGIGHPSVGVHPIMLGRKCPETMGP